MIRLAVIAAILMVTSAAHAQYTFEYGGKTIRIDPDRGTVSIPGIFDNTGRRSKRSRNEQEAVKKPGPDQAKANPQTPAPSPPITFPPPSAAADPAKAASPADVAPSPAATVKATPAATPKPPEQAATPEPLGLWLTEEKKGRVRIERCGVNLCGYSIDPKSNQNGEQVLVDMKPDKDASWSGRIFDPETGSTYDSTIALRGSDRLRLEGCAFGGMFCGAQIWSRLN